MGIGCWTVIKKKNPREFLKTFLNSVKLDTKNNSGSWHCSSVKVLAVQHRRPDNLSLSFAPQSCCWTSTLMLWPFCPYQATHYTQIALRRVISIFKIRIVLRSSQEIMNFLIDNPWLVLVQLHLINLWCTRELHSVKTILWLLHCEHFEVSSINYCTLLYLMTMRRDCPRPL